MVFKTDRQRKAVMAKLNQGSTRSDVAPQIIERKTIKVTKEINIPDVLTISDVKKINREAGQFFFTPQAMRFFESRIETKGVLINNRFFITSEQFISSTGKKDPRRFTVRELNRETGGIITVSKFNSIPTKKEAITFAERQK